MAFLRLLVLGGCFRCARRSSTLLSVVDLNWSLIEWCSIAPSLTSQWRSYSLGVIISHTRSYITSSNFDQSTAEKTWEENKQKFQGVLDEVWSVKGTGCLLCCPWIVYHPSTGHVSGPLIPIRQGFSLVVFACSSPSPDKSQLLLTLLARWPWLPQIYSC